MTFVYTIFAIVGWGFAILVLIALVATRRRGKSAWEKRNIDFINDDINQR